MNSAVHAANLILGNGGAAAHAVMGMRAAGCGQPIHLVCGEPGPAFNPMLLPYWLKGAIDQRGCFPFGADFHARFGVTAVLGSPAVSLDARRKTLALADGRSFTFGQCLIATGARALVPPLPGLRENPRVFTFRTRDCGHRLRRALDTARSAVVLGGSLVGVKLAEILAGRGLTVTLVDLAGQLLPGAAHPLAAGRIKELFQRRGVAVRLGSELSGVESASGGLRLEFRGHPALEADICCVCVGVRPNLDFLDQSQVPLATGVLVDERQRSRAPGVFAAGDAAEGLNAQTGRPQWFGLWGKACHQGRVAGWNMAGGSRAYPGTWPEFITPLLGGVFTSLGDPGRRGPGTRTLVCRRDDGDLEAVLVLDGGVLAGFNLLDRLEALPLLRGAALRRLAWPEAETGRDQADLDRMLAALSGRLGRPAARLAAAADR